MALQRLSSNLVKHENVPLSELIVKYSVLYARTCEELQDAISRIKRLEGRLNAIDKG